MVRRNVQNKQRRSRRSRRNRRQTRGHDLHPIVHGLLDPFSTFARGSKPLDNNSQRSIAIQAKLRNSLTTDANGMAAIKISPSLADALEKHTTIAGQTVTWSGVKTDFPEAATFAAFTGRVVSAAVRVFATTAMTASQGTIIFFSDENVDTTVTFDASSFLHGDVTSAPLAGADFKYIFKPQGDRSTDVPGDAALHDMNDLVVYIANAAASTSVIAIEMVLNLELYPVSNSIHSRMATNAAPSVPHLHAAIANKQAELPFVVPWSESLAGHAASVLEYAGAAAAGYYTGGMAGAASNLLLSGFQGTMAPRIRGPPIEVD